MLIKRFRRLASSGKKPAPSSPPENRWAIGIYFGDSPTNLRPLPEARNPVLTASDVRDADANFVADPFMILKDDIWHMFFEVEVRRREGNIGKIGLAVSRDGFSWEYKQIVLEASCHLSYPYVFEWEGRYYMIPETRSRREVRLYRSDDFPCRWRLESVLLRRKRFADTSIFRYRDRWWLFTDSGNTTLRLYAADDLKGPWREHRRSPILKKNPRFARPAGRVILHDGVPVRFAQDCQKGYGRRVWAFSVDALTASEYREKRLPAPVVGATGSGWNREGMHTVDAHQLENGLWIACVDGWGL